MVTIFLGLTMGSRYKEGNCSAVVLAKVTWYRLSCTVLVSRALNSKYSLFHILALSLSDTLESIGGLGEIKEGSQGCYLKNDSHKAKRIDLELVLFYSCSVHQEQDRNSNSLQDLQDLKQ